MSALNHYMLVCSACVEHGCCGSGMWSVGHYSFRCSQPHVMGMTPPYVTCRAKRQRVEGPPTEKAPGNGAPGSVIAGAAAGAPPARASSPCLGSALWGPPGATSPLAAVARAASPALPVKGAGALPLQALSLSPPSLAAPAASGAAAGGSSGETPAAAGKPGGGSTTPQKKAAREGRQVGR